MDVRMLYITLAVAAILVLATAAGLWWVTRRAHQLRQDQRINAVIAIAACFGGLLTAVVVAFTYVEASWASIERTRPQLLIQVTNTTRAVVDQEGRPIPLTLINYRNATANQFEDLTVHLSVRMGTLTLDLSDLFEGPMVMPGGDQRVRSWEPVRELSNRGLILGREGGAPAYLDASYSYSFRGRHQVVNAQQYRWNREKAEWEIPY